MLCTRQKEYPDNSRVFVIEETMTIRTDKPTSRSFASSVTDDGHTCIDRNGNAISFFKVMGRKPELLRHRHLQI